MLFVKDNTRKKIKGIASITGSVVCIGISAVVLYKIKEHVEYTTLKNQFIRPKDVRDAISINDFRINVVTSKLKKYSNNSNNRRIWKPRREKELKGLLKTKKILHKILEDEY